MKEGQRRDEKKKIKKTKKEADHLGLRGLPGKFVAGFVLFLASFLNSRFYH
jgi:hypothetical protein